MRIDDVAADRDYLSLVETLLFEAEDALRNIDESAMPSTQMVTVKKLVGNTYEFIRDGDVFVFVDEVGVSARSYAKLMEFGESLQRLWKRVPIRALKNLIHVIMAYVYYVLLIFSVVFGKTKVLGTLFAGSFGTVLVSGAMGGIFIPLVAYFVSILFAKLLVEPQHMELLAQLFARKSAQHMNKYRDNTLSTVKEEFTFADVVQQLEDELGDEPEEPPEPTVDELVDIFTQLLKDDPHVAMDILGKFHEALRADYTRIATRSLTTVFKEKIKRIANGFLNKIPFVKNG